VAAPFYRYALHFSSDAVASANFLPNLLGTFAGAAVGGALVARFGARRAVLFAGTLQAASLALYIVLAWHPVPAMLSAKIGGEYFAGAAADTAFLAYVSTLCSREYSASQYALLSSLAALVFHTLGGAAGYGAEALGWVPFFGTCILASVPALLILGRLKDERAVLSV
jgi:PAT family beta-lactamase induction signal transducer AmpG